jgi:hypothetical protein
MKIQNNIKDNAFSDYRTHIPGVICDIIECNQYAGFSAVLKVSPIGYMTIDTATSETQKLYNVICCGSIGVYGFPTLMKDLYYAYVLTDNPSLIEGRPALIIPKTFLYRNPGDSYATEPDMLLKDELKKMIVKKEVLVRARKFA